MSFTSKVCVIIRKIQATYCVEFRIMSCIVGDESLYDRVRDDSAEKNLPLRPIFREAGGVLQSIFITKHLKQMFEVLV